MRNRDKRLMNKIYNPIERRGRAVNLIVHPPKDPESLSILQKRVAVVHAEAVLKYISNLPCSKEQKIKLINSLKEKCLRDDPQS